MTTLREAAQQALEEHANRYQVVRDGYWWRVKIGNGTQTVGQYHTEAGALRLASDLNRAFHDGGFVVQEALRAALAQQAEPAPGWCKHCKQYSIEEPLPAQQAEPTQTPCDIAEDGVCEVIDCCRNPKQAEPVKVVQIGDTSTPHGRLATMLAEALGADHPAMADLAAIVLAAPPQRKPLTEEEIYEMYSEPSSDAEMVEFARALERAHGIGGDDGQA